MKPLWTREQMPWWARLQAGSLEEQEKEALKQGCSVGLCKDDGKPDWISKNAKKAK